MPHWIPISSISVTTTLAQLWSIMKLFPTEYLSTHSLLPLITLSQLWPIMEVFPTGYQSPQSLVLLTTLIQLWPIMGVCLIRYQCTGNQSPQSLLPPTTLAQLWLVCSTGYQSPQYLLQPIAVTTVCPSSYLAYYLEHLHYIITVESSPHWENYFLKSYTCWLLNNVRSWSKIKRTKGLISADRST